MTLPESDDTNQKLSAGNRKLFVGGLHWSTTEKALADYMNKFGHTEYVKIVYDNYTGRSRGFGFIKFIDDSTIDKVINSGPHILNEKKIDPKPALPISTESSIDDLNDHSATVSKKIFVGGLKHDLSDESIHNYFSSFGAITEIKFYYQKNTNLRRGFCFVEYEEIESAQKALENRYHKIDNETVEVKVAQRRPIRSSYNMKNSFKLSPSYNPNFIPYYEYSPYYYVDQPHSTPYNSLYYVMPYYYNYNVSSMPKDTMNPPQVIQNNTGHSPPSTPRSSKNVPLPLAQQ